MKKINKTILYTALGALIVGILIGWLLIGKQSSKIVADKHQHEEVDNTTWTCSMHPQIRQSEPGNCPICGMDLIPLQTNSNDGNPLAIKMSATAMQLANIQTSVITKQQPIKEVQLTGIVKADERKISSQSSHVPGRIEKLLVNYTGESVKKGQLLAYIYSPELVTAQEELFEAYKIRESQPELYNAVRTKLLNWKLTEFQIDKIINSGQPQEQFPILADISGTVLTKKVNLGDYINKGQSLFEIVDLSQVWVLFDVHESDMVWIKENDQIEFTVQSIPSKLFKSSVKFINPVINPKTRTSSARVEIQNNNEELKPDMFASGIVKSVLKKQSKALIVPKSAVMWTGKRSVVYIKQNTETGVSFLLQNVTLGPSLGDSYVIEDGLSEGVEIATNGTFSIDAAAQLAGKPSMMNPEGGAISMGHNHGGAPTQTSTNHNGQSKTIVISESARQSLNPLFDEYIRLKDAFVEDDLEKAKAIASTLLEELDKINMNVFEGKAHNLWMQYHNEIKKSLKTIKAVENIGEGRKGFKNLSDQFIIMVKSFGSIGQTLYIQQCPMANTNKGADWISNKKEIKNPYFGESMLTCGEIIQTIK